jgi:hypothetical protein
MKSDKALREILVEIRHAKPALAASEIDCLAGCAPKSCPQSHLWAASGLIKPHFGHSIVSLFSNEVCEAHLGNVGSVDSCAPFSAPDGSEARMTEQGESNSLRDNRTAQAIVTMVTTSFRRTKLSDSPPMVRSDPVSLPAQSTDAVAINPLNA